MNMVLVLRAEIVCLIILIYLAFISHTYRMGKDGRIFNRILILAVTHVVLDIITVWTVNHTETVSISINNLAHILFFLSAILYSYEVCFYVLNMVRPKQMDRKKYLLGLIPVFIYLILLCTPFLNIEYVPLDGTWASVGWAPAISFIIAFTYCVAALVSIFIHWKKVSGHFKRVMLPMLFLLLATETIQTQVVEFLFTGCAVTAITVAFFFTLENPAVVLEKKIMFDALSGLGTRTGYEHDLTEFEQEFEQNRDAGFTFMFIDINNLRRVNGLYGHQEGDSYITNMAVLLVNSLRGASRIYRMGGDEFLAVYRKADEKVVVRDIRRVHEACSKGREHREYTPELAIGYAVSGPKYNSLRDVLRVADYMMYRNKADLKREIAEDMINHTGTRLNLTGLTDRVFDAMCLTSEEYYPYLNNLETDVTRVAPAMAEFFGLESEFISNFSNVWMEHVHPDDLEEYVTDISATLSGRKQYHYCRYRARAKDGKYVQVTCRGGVYHGRDGEPDIFAGYLVNHGAPETIDSLTGLKNHHAMFEHMEGAFRQNNDGVVMRIELRNMNRIRMLYGAAVAASLIRNMASDFAGMTGETGEVFSERGSDFMFCLPGCDTVRANELYRMIRNHCKAGILTDSEVIPVEISGGAVLMPDETLSTPGAVRQAALFACEEAYYNNASSLWFFGDSTGGSNSAEKELLKIIQHDCVMDRTRFFLRFQPIIHAQTGTIAGAEALLRWKSDEDGEVAPGRFIAFLENDPAYEPLGYDIIRYAVRISGRFRKYIPDFRINVNITAIQLLADDFIPNVVKILEEEQCDPSFLMLELTERCKEMEFGLLNGRVAELKKTGIQVALDDMGTGFSTIDLLLHLNADEIKLDMAFTHELRGVEKHEIFARTLCESAAKHGTDVCFEGVEDGNTAEYLKEYGDVLLQGYYFDRPMLPEEFERKYCKTAEG